MEYYKRREDGTNDDVVERREKKEEKNRRRRLSSSPTKTHYFPSFIVSLRLPSFITNKSVPPKKSHGSFVTQHSAFITKK